MLTGTIVARPLAAWASAVPMLAGIDDTSNTRKLQIIVGGLAALGVFLLLFTVWFWRSSRADHGSLGPLEVMGARRWRRAPMNEQINRLSEVRPKGAMALAGADRPAVDLAALVAGHRSSTPDRHGGGFSDLVEGEPHSLVASVEEHWDGDLGILDAETEFPAPAGSLADDESSAAAEEDSFDPDHSPRPSAEDIARIEAAASESPIPPASDGPALPEQAEMTGEAVPSGETVPSGEAVPSDDASIVGSAEVEPVANKVSSDGAEIIDESFDGVPIEAVATDAADEVVADEEPEPGSDGSSEPSSEVEHRQPTTSGSEAVPPAGESAAESTRTAGGSKPFDDAHPHDAGDALADALAPSEPDNDAEFDPSKELAFERPEPVASAAGRGAVTDSFKPPRWRRFRR